MLPGSTGQRKARERGHRVDGRSQEIQRLIGRSLRALVNLRSLPEVTLWVDCDVIQADGGTRTAAINGASVALHDAFKTLEAADKLPKWPMYGMLGAISVGIVNGRPMVDLDYSEDSKAGVDMNVVTLSDGRMVEIQGSAEGVPFTDAQFQEMLQLARRGCTEVNRLQREAIEA